MVQPVAGDSAGTLTYVLRTAGAHWGAVLYREPEAPEAA